ncbi:MAG: hypothetical protein AB7R89_09290 [Dehalococcoidia bacterium]
MLLQFTLLTATMLLAGCADAPVIYFANESDAPVSISVDGDRLLVLRPHSSEGLPYSTAAWAWPRRIDARSWPEGRLLWSESVDADQLARHRFRLFVGS